MLKAMDSSPSKCRTAPDPSPHWVAGLALAAALTGTLLGCSPGFDPKNAIGEQAIIDQSNLELSRGDCTSAVARLKPVYNSVDTDNEIRRLMSSAYGCDATINL